MLHPGYKRRTLRLARRWRGERRFCA